MLYFNLPIIQKHSIKEASILSFSIIKKLVAIGYIGEDYDVEFLYIHNTVITLDEVTAWGYVHTKKVLWGRSSMNFWKY